ncbi:hypothetical protein F5X99DRAFT_375214 [Biscogniauxia marginata]|nr:hypothetical protein F5X99DRAFT_375214 [Biscogniauxia marginata]
MNPVIFNSFKCGHCISSKSSCTLSIDNPGIEYPAEVTRAARNAEQEKRDGREKAKATKERKKAASTSTESQTSSPSTEESQVSPPEPAEPQPSPPTN